MVEISGLSQKCPDFVKIMSGILDPRILTFWNSDMDCTTLTMGKNNIEYGLHNIEYGMYNIEY